MEGVTPETFASVLKVCGYSEEKVPVLTPLFLAACEAKKTAADQKASIKGTYVDTMGNTEEEADYKILKLELEGADSRSVRFETKYADFFAPIRVFRKAMRENLPARPSPAKAGSNSSSSS